MSSPTLHLMCGKIASGKSTLAKALATEHCAIVLSEDKWLSSLYPGEINSVADYVRYAQRIRGVVGPLVIDMLESGVSVVLDFPANTLANRQSPIANRQSRMAAQPGRGRAGAALFALSRSG